MVTFGALFLKLIFFVSDGLHKFTVRLVDGRGDGFVA